MQKKVYKIWKSQLRSNMKKIYLILISTIVFILVLLIVLYMYNIFDYAKGEQNDFRENFNSKKNFILSLSFEGKIQNKVDEILINKKHRYSITLILNNYQPKPSISKLQYPTYYGFNNDSILNLTVSKKIFDNCKINQVIHKKNNDYSVNINGNMLLLLNKLNDKWLP